MNSNASPRPRRRRLTWLVLYALFLLVLIEGGSWVALLALGRGVGPAEVLDDERATDVQRAASQAAGGLRKGSIHPYVGFLPRSRDEIEFQNGRSFYQREFFEPDSPVFSDDGDVYVVGVTGGSVAAFFVRGAGGQELARRLEAMPHVEGRTVRYAALAAGGFKQPQQLMAMNYILALGARLDALVNLDGFNEIALHESDNQRNGVAPIYPRAWAARVGNSTIIGPQLAQLAVAYRERLSLARSAATSPLRHSFTYELVWSLRDRKRQRDLRELQESISSTSIEGDLILNGPTLSGTTRAESLDELVGIWRRCSVLLDRACSAKGIEYYHFLQPNQYVPDSKPLSAAERAEAFRPDHNYGRVVPDGYARLRASGASLLEAGVRFEDLTDIFAEEERTIYRDDCCHMNELGNALIAEAVAESIASHH